MRLNTRKKYRPAKTKSCAAITDDENDFSGIEFADRIYDILDHSPAIDFVQDFGAIALHPLALARGQYNRAYHESPPTM